MKIGKIVLDTVVLPTQSRHSGFSDCVVSYGTSKSGLDAKIGFHASGAESVELSFENKHVKQRHWLIRLKSPVHDRKCRQHRNSTNHNNESKLGH